LEEFTTVMMTRAKRMLNPSVSPASPSRITPMIMDTTAAAKRI